MQNISIAKLRRNQRRKICNNTLKFLKRRPHSHFYNTIFAITHIKNASFIASQDTALIPSRFAFYIIFRCQIFIGQKNNSYFSYTFKAAPEPSKHLLTTILYLSNDAKYESIFPASDIMTDFEIVNEMLRRRKIQKNLEMILNQKILLLLMSLND